MVFQVLALHAHLIGDYVLQSHIMAVRKTSSWKWALIHALFYGIPFAGLLLFVTPDLTKKLIALVIIIGTHAVIDRYRLAVYWCKFYGAAGYPGLWWRYFPGPEEVFEPPRAFLQVWLIILVDNTMHLCINALALWYASSGG